MNRDKALLKLQMIDFALIDVGLYLDAYPSCKKALEYFQQLEEMREVEVKEFEKMYGPLTIMSLEDTNYNTYINDPWPWEREA